MTEGVTPVIPGLVTSFLGRGRELAEGERLLGETRLLTITGPGGAGKTRFALELARRRADRYDAIATCLLAPLRDPSLLLPSVALALGVAEQPGRGALETIVEHTEGQRVLVVLDNLEHLSGAWGDVAALVGSCPDLRVLCTSRERLRLHGELAFDLPPLTEQEAVALLCERARVEPSGGVEELARHLEGLPLAIELAAARLALLSPEQLLARLSRRLDLLRHPDMDPRQQTLRATLEWSYDLLTDEERRVFRALSVFAGGCTAKAAREVCGAALDALASLADKSLLRRNDERLWMLETIREYAAQLLAEPERDGLRRAHAEWFTARALESDVALAHGDRAVMDALEADAENLRAALSFCLEHDPYRALDCARALDRYWQRGGRDREGYELLRRALSLAPADVLPLDRGRGLIAAASLAIRMSMLDEAGALLDEAVRELRRAGSPPRVAAALNNQGLVALLRGDYAGARPCLEESLAIRREVGDRRFVAPPLSNLGKLALYEGKLDEALELLEEAAALRRETDSAELHQTLFDLAIARLLGGDEARAVEVAAAALASAESRDDPVGTIECGALLAVCSVVSGDTDRAGDALRAALERTLDGYEGRLPFVLWATAGYAAARGNVRDGLLLLGATAGAGAAEGGPGLELLWGRRVRESGGDGAEQLLARGQAHGSARALARAQAVLGDRADVARAPV